MSIVGAIVNDRVVNDVLDLIYKELRKTESYEVQTVLDRLEEKVSAMLGDE